jgi:hypothetical protein
VACADLFSVANDLHAQTVRPKPTAQDVVVQPYEPCKLLEPYGWWWFFWGCNEGGK